MFIFVIFSNVSSVLQELVCILWFYANQRSPFLYRAHFIFQLLQLALQSMYKVYYWCKGPIEMLQFNMAWACFSQEAKYVSFSGRCIFVCGLNLCWLKCVTLCDIFLYEIQRDNCDTVDVDMRISQTVIKYSFVP